MSRGSDAARGPVVAHIRSISSLAHCLPGASSVTPRSDPRKSGKPISHSRRIPNIDMSYRSNMSGHCRYKQRTHICIYMQTHCSELPNQDKDILSTDAGFPPMCCHPVSVEKSLMACIATLHPRQVPNLSWLGCRKDDISSFTW
ncbi:hypothetical protein EVAR_28964_1 [Eumeta japonica]|uniref:Uncharacterized protein n=1 Tax=Eumeta variegata TaxID=151549 RepID=A0A4C1VXP1_EUMVA|nr:hypothetical protein EVAR_28964_1 [Eumeta japonica]